MAFVSRAPRGTMLAPGSAGDVGPGSYAPESAPRRDAGRRNYAAFNSTAARDGLGASTEFTPGPGAYHHVESASRRAASSAAFRNAAPRFREMADGEGPGPGAYDLPSSIRLRPHTTAEAAPAASKRFQWVRMATVPSIPAPSQSYGYDETATGELVQQQPPELGHRGDTRDAPGPGEYTPDVSPTRRRQDGPGWSRSRATRGTVARSDAPGPGTYNAPTYNSRRRPMPSSSFASRSMRPYQRPLEDDGIPGPGSYVAASSIRSSHVPESMQCFGSTSTRFEDRRFRERAPGPGAYENAQSGFASRKRFTLTEPSPFDSSAPRFDARMSVAHEAPGPGSYDDPRTIGDRSMHVVPRRGAFGSTAERSPQRSREVAPGPGAYDTTGADESPVKAWRRRQPSSSFASTADRMRMKEADGPAPDAYTLPSSILERKSFNRKGHYGSRDKRDGSALINRNAINNPGPGAYQTNVDPSYHLRTQARSQVMVSTAPRFRSAPAAEAPGPGQYNLARPLLRRSFNVTVDNPDIDVV